MIIEVCTIDYRTKRQIQRRVARGASFYTHDNGGKPIAVKLDVPRKTVKVFFRKYNDMKGTARAFRKPAFVFTDVKQVFVGYGEIGAVDYRPRTIGNAFLLVQEQNQIQTCTYVGISVEQFTLKQGERVLNYVSLVGNNDVPCGYTVTTKGIYTLFANNCSNSFIPNKVLKNVFGSLDQIPVQDDFIICSLLRNRGVLPFKNIRLLSERVSDIEF